MNTRILMILFLSLDLFCILVKAENPPFQDRIAQTHDIEFLMRLSAELEASWPTNASDYFHRQDQLNEALQSITSTNAKARTFFELQANQTLAKKCPNDISIFQSCFWAKSEIMARVSIAQSAPNGIMAQRMAQSLGEVRSAIITNYHWATTYVNVMPPVMPKKLSTNHAGIMSGMAVDAIQDPVAREAYRRAIETNRLNNIQNGLQGSFLPTVNSTMTASFLGYAKRLLIAEPKSRSQIGSLARTARLTDKERSELEAVK